MLALLRRRPDLALPAPVDLATLSSRASVRSSVARALDSLDAFTLRVLEVSTVVEPPVTVAAVAAWFPAEHAPAVARALDRLREWLLVWGSADLHAVGSVREVIGHYPAGLGRSARDLYAAVNDLALIPLARRLGLEPASQPTSGQQITEAVLGNLDVLLEGCDGPQRDILNRLADGPPIGALRGATLQRSPAEAPSPARALLERGLLVPIDRDTVELPREVGLRIRAVAAGEVDPEPSQIATSDRGPSVIDSGGATEVLEIVRLVELLLQTMSDEPAGQLRAGGVGVRDLRRLARSLDIPESQLALLLEVSFEAGLFAATHAIEPSYLPTTEFDQWRNRTTAQRWVVLASAWLAMTRMPSLVGERDERDKTIAALSADVERHSAAGLRLQIMGILAQVPPGLAPLSEPEVLDRLAWQSPRRASTNRVLAAAMLGEATLLGITGYGALTGYSRALLDGAESGAAFAEANATALLAAALPDTVDEFLLQPDLTAVVPGPPTADLQRELGLVADLESTGGASVYRIGPASLRRALDAGRSGSDVTRFFTDNSRTPVPQALQYLINDVATQHGRLRAGTATSYLRCDDEAMLDRVLAQPGLDALGLQRIAPTVIISPAGISLVLERLRAAGFAPAAESADGAIVNLSADAPRVPARPTSRLARVRATSVPESQLLEVVSRLRASEKLAHAITRSTNRVSQEVPGVTSASILELLRAAIRSEQTIALGYVDDAGRPSQRTLMPISLGGGVVRGHEPDNSRLLSYPLQRITTVSLLEEPEELSD
ncbi:helicase-associated domain-containing protein [Jatrophihabitans telluris]|uniref:Helicase-associated domain-containing protein n=1 Tax=Jatrophihabitans telluris TaxID=2038343 RepID=A0ABY4R052_9ACTN|nr:helicase-associated domain-containing protein [Jatrophihabitans telluris]UQX89114.1 helicase-associated domain-containing protein [Jatrophihabitans telluris]